ncbi:MAG: dienelactone hydrolase family protein [Devosia nanyangense]|uniref:Dienelactone hydrolase family protein n=1 Tax=Devosia nanyangense TaxID=1228055 RepID=A0A933L671_9HYPH|nr:dienelactone hydrolase family protein [Devosia nanyangense]
MTTKLSGPMLPAKSGAAPRQLMVLLHGYGADGSDLIGLGLQWRDVFPDMLFVAPNAPEPCDINPAGYQWFPLAIDRDAGRIEGAAKARPVLVEFVRDLWAQTGLGARDTVLCGFSQGAMMALHVGTSLDEELWGIVSFSGAFIPPEGFGAKPLAKPPVAIIHGDIDNVVPVQFSRDAAAVLAVAGFDVGFHISSGAGHAITPDGFDFATEFLVSHLPAKA